MGTEWTSAEMSMMAHTVPSRSKEDFLKEAAEAVYHRDVTKAQIQLADATRKMAEKVAKCPFPSLVIVGDRVINELEAETELLATKLHEEVDRVIYKLRAICEARKMMIESSCAPE